MKVLPPILLIILASLPSWAGTNLVKRSLPSAADFTITYFPAEGGVLVRAPHHRSKLKLPKHISFSDAQKWEVVKLLETYLSFLITLEENEVKPFSKSLGGIREAKDDSKWTVGLEATINIAQEGKALLILELKDRLLGHSRLVVLDQLEARSVVELIKMVPDMKNEAQTGAAK